jgi:hypothetical protein
MTLTDVPKRLDIRVPFFALDPLVEEIPKEGLACYPHRRDLVYVT